jgi:tetratricopeptide (TPR) repeat protein
MSLAALALAAAIAAGPVDDRYRAALDVLYDGSTETALARLAALSAESPRDAVGPYLEALALCWKVEERPESRDLDRELVGKADRALELADALLSADPSDARARFARGAAHGVKSRLALFRLERREAAHEAARMREDLTEAHRLDPDASDTLFGLGLYDYYVDVLPRAAKVIRFLLGMPGGDRARGLEEIAAARNGSLFHGTEVRAQLYEIFAFYERDPDAAETEMAALHEKYPDSPLWALKLAEHRRDRMGSYGESAATARDILEAARAGRPNVAPITVAMARLSVGESLLRDLRLVEAEAVLRSVADTAPRDVERLKALLLLAEALELQGRRDEAVVDYRAAQGSTDRDVRRHADRRLAKARPPAEVAALRLVAAARRLRESGDTAGSLERYLSAFRLWPACREAEVGAAQAALRAAMLDAAGRRLEAAAVEPPEDEDSPPWVAAWARLLLAQLRDATGAREEAVALYNQVLKHPIGQAELRREAEAGLKEAWRPARDASARPDRMHYSK